MKRKAKKRLASVVALSVNDGQLRVAHAAREKNAIAILKAASVPLTLSLQHPEPELVGREIKNHLEAAGIRERHCVVALPPDWIMSLHIKVPGKLAPEDAASLLQIEAEKGFPSDFDELQIATSPHGSADAAYVTQLAVRKQQLTQLSAVLQGAGLKPASFTLGLAALPGAVGGAGQGRITLLLEPKSATLLIAAGGGIVAFRTLEATIESEAGEHVINGPALARELRITFEQIPGDLRSQIGQLALRGDAKLTAQLAESLAAWARDVGLTIDVPTASTRNPREEIVEELARRQLQEGGSAFEFLPPHPSRWSLLMARYNSKRLASAGFAAAAAALVLAGAFAWQEYRRWSLRSEWESMSEQVGDLGKVRALIKEYSPWYDESYRNLMIMKRVVECFPDTGSVTAKSVEIHGLVPVVSVSGSARDNASLLRTLDQLGKVKEIRNVKIDQIRGKPPQQQFTFTFRWVGLSGT